MDAGEVLYRAAGDQHQRADHRDREQDADGPAHQVGPEVTELSRTGPGEAPHECHRDGHTHGRRDEVLHREATGLHDMAHGLLAGIRLPVGVRDERRGGVERLVRIDGGKAQRPGERALNPLHQVKEEDTHRRKGENAAQICGPPHFGGRVGADGPVNPLLRSVMIRGGVDLGHVIAQWAVCETEGADHRCELEQASDLGAHTGPQNLSGARRARMRCPSRKTATVRPMMSSTVTAWSPPGDESHQCEHREYCDDEGQVGHRELLIDVRKGIRPSGHGEQTPASSLRQAALMRSIRIHGILDAGLTRKAVDATKRFEPHHGQ